MMEEPLLGEEERETFSSSLLLNLYVGHFLARWGARFKFFGSSLILDVFQFYLTYFVVLCFLISSKLISLVLYILDEMTV